MYKFLIQRIETNTKILITIKKQIPICHSIPRKNTNFALEVLRMNSLIKKYSIY